MLRFSILLGSAPEDYRQKKIEDMFNFLDSKRNKGDSIVTFANGISEMMLELVLDNSIKQLASNCHSRARAKPSVIVHGNLSLQEDCRLKPDNDVNVKSNDDTNVKNGNDSLSHSATQSCHSELDSESTNSRHFEAKPKNLFLQKMFRVAQHNGLLLYTCTLQPVGDGEESFWLGGEEIRRDVILHYQELAAECGIDMQVVFDFDSEMVSEEELGWEEVIEPVEIAKQENFHEAKERYEII